MPDTETTDLKEKFVTHGSQEEALPHATEVHMGKHQHRAAGSRGEGRHGHSLSCGLHGKKEVRQGREDEQASDCML